MYIKHLLALNCWIVTFGTDIIDIDGQRLFETKQDLLAALKRKGLRTCGDKVLYN